MPNIGPLELVVVLIIALIVFGPKRLPELGRSVGKAVREFRGSISGEHDDEDEQRDAKPAQIETAEADSKDEAEVVAEKRS